MLTLWDVYDRSVSGPPASETDFDTKILFKKTQQLVKEYDIKFDPKKIVDVDKSLCREVFEAGLRLLTEVGIYCLDTNRLIKVSEEEVKEALRSKQSQITLGHGNDATHVVSRSLRFDAVPFICAGPCGGPLSDNIYVECHQSYAQEPLVDSIHTGSLYEIQGREIRTGSPLEVLAARCEGLWSREAINRANRPGLSILGVMTAVSLGAVEVADLEGGLRGCDMHEVSFLNELKTDWRLLNKIFYNHQAGNITVSCQIPMIGGLAGGPEGTAIAAVATTLQGLILGGTLHAFAPLNSRLIVNTDRTAIWTQNVHNIALRESGYKVITGDYVGPSAGPCTEMIIQELAARSISSYVTGASGIFGISSAKGNIKDRFTGMEGRIVGELIRASTKLNAEAGNAIVDSLISKYEKIQNEDKAPIGKTFQELYDLKTVRPIEEYVSLWENAKKGLQDIGLNL